MKKNAFGLLCLIICEFYGMAQTRVDTIVMVNDTKVELRYPDTSVKGVILVLPGWNFPQDDICIKSDFCSRAKSAGYVLVMPDMKKSIYQQQYYPETRRDWLHYHSITWLTDTLVPLMQQRFTLLVSGAKNYLFGISTGARGVARMATATKGIFIAGAALSGDYNQELMPQDNLMKGYYGPYDTFPSRWKEVDNPGNNAGAITIPLFLAHGIQDKVVPCNQTSLFYSRLHMVNSSIKHKLVMKEGAGHDYDFWSSMYNEVFGFFGDH